MDKNIVVFDFDNTLVDSLKYWYKVQENLMFKKYGKKPDKRFCELRRGKNNKQVAELFAELTNSNLTYQQVFDDWNTFMKYFYTNKIRLLKGAKQFLLNLKQQGKTIVLASATETEALQVALQHFGLSEIFDKVYTETIVGYSKKEPEFFDELLKLLDAKAEDVLFFEDFYFSIKNATSRGIETCAIVHKYNKKYLNEIKSICKVFIKNYSKLKVEQL